MMIRTGISTDDDRQGQTLRPGGRHKAQARIGGATSIVALMLALLASPHRAQADDLRQTYDQIRAANSIDDDGRPPFHLKIAAQLYDLDGKPSGTATAEEWWAAGKYHAELETPEGKQVLSSDPPAVSHPVTRSMYLLQELLKQNIDPVGRLGAQVPLKSSERRIDGTTLRCLSAVKSGVERGHTVDKNETYCTLVGQSGLLISELEDAWLNQRSQTGTFNGAKVALKTEIKIDGKPAIAGDVKVLSTFDPKTSPFPEFGPLGTEASKPASADSGSAGPSQPTVVAGHILVAPNMEYLKKAKTGGKTGTVIVALLISPTGEISSLAVISSPSPQFSKAVLDAFGTCTFTPTTLRGKPVALLKRIAIHF